MSATTTTSPQIGSFTRVMRVLYIIFAWLFAICILIQVFLAGLNIFSPSATITWSLHISFAHYIEYIPILLIILALLGRFPRSLPLFSLLLLVQFVLQYAFIRVAPTVNVLALAAFHPVNAVVMFWVSIHVARRAGAYLKALS